MPHLSVQEIKKYTKKVVNSRWLLVWLVAAPLSSPPGGAHVLQQQHQQAVLQAEHLAAVRLPKRDRQPAAQRAQVGQSAAGRDVEQRVEQLQPQLAVGVPVETSRAFSPRFYVFICF